MEGTREEIVSPFSPLLKRRQGKFIGKISSALVGFQNSVSNRIFEWDIQNTDIIKSNIPENLYAKIDWEKGKTKNIYILCCNLNHITIMKIHMKKSKVKDHKI